MFDHRIIIFISFSIAKWSLFVIMQKSYPENSLKNIGVGTFLMKKSFLISLVCIFHKESIFYRTGFDSLYLEINLEF